MDRRAFLTTIAAGAGLVAAPVIFGSPALAAKAEIFTGLNASMATEAFMTSVHIGRQTSLLNAPG